MTRSTIATTVALFLGTSACAGTLPSGPGAPATAEVVTQFDPAAGELPEGLALTANAAFVGFAPTSRIARIDAATGDVTPYGQLPMPVPNQGFMTGLAISPSGEVFAGLASFSTDVQAGIYRVPAEGGDATLFAKDDALAFPNALTFDEAGTLWVTDSGSGSVFRIDHSGHAERWATGETLTGDAAACGGAGPGFAIGANGIVVEHDAVYVVNMDQATLVEIPRERGGESGQPRIIAGPDCAMLGGADGLVRAPDGSFIIAVNRQDRLVRVTRDGALEVLVSGPPLDFPATVAYRGTTLFVTNFALRNASAGLRASPGLVRVRE